MVVPTSQLDSSNSTSAINTGSSQSPSAVSASQIDSTETLTTYTTLTTCPVTNTYVSGSSTRLETVLTTSTVVVTSCQGGCSRFTFSTPTPTGNLYNSTLASTTPSDNSISLPSQTSSLQSDFSPLASVSSSVIYANDTTITTSSATTASVPAQVTVSSSSYAMSPVANDTTSSTPVYVYSQPSLANASSPTLTTSMSYSANVPIPSPSSLVVSDITWQNLTVSLLQSSLAIQVSSEVLGPTQVATEPFSPSPTLSLVGPSSVAQSVYGESTQASAASQFYATAGSTAQALSSGYAVVTVPIGSPIGPNTYASYTELTLNPSSSNLGQGIAVDAVSASSSTPLVLVFGSSTTTVNGYLGYGIPTASTSMATLSVTVSPYGSVPLGSDISNSVTTSVLVDAVAVTSTTSGSGTLPTDGLLSALSTIISTVTVSPLPYGVRGSSSIAGSLSSSAGSQVVSSPMGTASTSIQNPAYGSSSPSVSGSSVTPATYAISPEVASSSSMVSLSPGSYILTTDLYGSSTALPIVPSTSSAIYSYLVDAVQGSSTSAGALPGYTPVYTPEVLGNAYGGGFVSTPTVYVSSSAGSGANGIPPGYGFSVLVVGSSTASTYASGSTDVSTLSTPQIASGVYVSGSTASSTLGGSIASIPSVSFQSGIPSTLVYDQGGASSSPAGPGAAFVGVVAPSSDNNGATPASTTSTTNAVVTVLSSTSSSRGNMTSSVSVTAPAMFTGDASQARVAWSSIILGLLVLIYVL